MNAGRWEQLKEAFWKAAQDGGGEACVSEAWDVDPASRDQLRLLLDEHRRLAQAGAAAPAEPAAAGVLPPGRFGATVLDGHRVTQFLEKPAGDGGYINGGFFVLRKRVLERIAGDETSWEAAPLESLARDRQLAAYIHAGFWRPMDTLRDKKQLEDMWASGSAPWKVWKNKSQ